MTVGPLMLIALFGAHWFFDYAGQGDFMAKAKNPKTPIPGIPSAEIMFAHAGIHAAAVALITGVWWLFILELIAHMFTDLLKCQGAIGFVADQNIHLACKIVWFALAWWALR